MKGLNSNRNLQVLDLNLDLEQKVEQAMGKLKYGRQNPKAKEVEAQVRADHLKAQKAN